MVRTQIYLPEPLHKKLVRLGKDRGQSMAEVIREYIALGIKKEDPDLNSGRAVIEQLISKKTHSGIKDLASNMDHYLYG